MEITGGLLHVVGVLVALANAFWLWARLDYPRDMTRVEATAIFLPAMLFGIALFYIGRRLCQGRPRRINGKEDASQPPPEN